MSPRLQFELDFLLLSLNYNVQCLITAVNVPDIIIVIIYNQISGIKYFNLLMLFYTILSKKLSVTLIKHVKYCSMILNDFHDAHCLNIQVFSTTNCYTSNIQYKNECSNYLIYNVYDLVYVWMFLVISIYVTEYLNRYEFFLLRKCIVYGPIYGYININSCKYETILLLLNCHGMFFRIVFVNLQRL